MNDVTVTPPPPMLGRHVAQWPQGVRRTRGHSPAVIKAQLRRQGITPVRVHVRSSLLCGLGNPITPADIALFTANWDPAEGGNSLLQAFDMIGEGLTARPCAPCPRAEAGDCRRQQPDRRAIETAAVLQPPVLQPDRGRRTGRHPGDLAGAGSHHLEKSQRSGPDQEAMTYPLWSCSWRCWSAASC